MPDIDIPHFHFGQTADIVTFTGTAAAGKGTAAGAAERHFGDAGRHVLLVDQGLKFRAIAYLAREHGIDIDDPTALDAFLTEKNTLDGMIDMLRLGHDVLKKTVHVPAISDITPVVAKRQGSHDLALGSMHRQVSEGVQAGVDMVLLDGRALEGEAEIMQQRGLGSFAVGFYVECTPRTAAQRILGLIGDESNRTAEERRALDERERQTALRNLNDSTRDINPLLPPIDAHRLDIMRYSGLHQPAKWKIADTRMVFADTSASTDPTDLTLPVIDIVDFATSSESDLSNLLAVSFMDRPLSRRF